MNVSDRTTIVFVKEPGHAPVKTRLAVQLGRQAATSLYRAMVEDLCAGLQPACGRVLVAYTPDAARDAMEAWLGNERAYMPQGEGDLGRRMHRAFSRVFAGGVRRAVLVGSDCPHLSGAGIAQALSLLERSPCVLGPAWDGGYYLIGFQAARYAPAVFDGIAWSSPQVCAQTRVRLAQAGLRAAELPVLRDIDTHADMIWLAGQVSQGALPGSSRVRRVLARLQSDGGAR